jgi:hypothetical protein
VAAGRHGDDSLIIVMGSGASRGEVDRVVERIRSLGAEVHISVAPSRTVIAAVGDRSLLREVPWGAFSGVDRVLPALNPLGSVGVRGRWWVYRHRGAVCG